MPVSVKLNLTQAERDQLAGVLACDKNDLDKILEPYAAAALEEYGRMFIGQRVFTRGRDIQEYRLFLLIRGPFKNAIPDEQAVCDLFQTTTTQSRALIRSVMSKYQYELSQAITDTLKKHIAEAQPDGADWTITVNSENIVEHLNRQIAALDGTLPQIEKKRGAISMYTVRPSAYQKLREHFNLP
jgi:hypothetical protein